jgi:hypothetical protein
MGSRRGRVVVSLDASFHVRIGMITAKAASEMHTTVCRSRWLLVRFVRLAVVGRLQQDGAKV